MVGANSSRVKITIKVETREGGFVAATLPVAQTKLEKDVGL